MSPRRLVIPRPYRGVPLRAGEESAGEDKRPPVRIGKPLTLKCGRVHEHSVHVVKLAVLKVAPWSNAAQASAGQTRLKRQLVKRSLSVSWSNAAQASAGQTQPKRQLVKHGARISRAGETTRCRSWWGGRAWRSLPLASRWSREGGIVISGPPKTDGSFMSFQV